MHLQSWSTEVDSDEGHPYMVNHRPKEKRGHEERWQHPNYPVGFKVRASNPSTSTQSEYGGPYGATVFCAQ